MFKKTWDEWYKLAEAYYNYHGNLNVKQRYRTENGYEYDEDGYRLGVWLSNQREKNKRGLLPKEQKQKLESLGFHFETIQSIEWNKMYELAKAYYNHNAHLKIQQHFRTFNGYDYDAEGYRLGMWLSNQKERNKRGLLVKEQRKKLEALGVDFEMTQDLRWNRMYELAKAYYEQYNHLKIQQHFRTFNGWDYDDKGYKLGIWLNDQRIQYKKGELSQERIQRLTLIGAVLENVRDDNWNKMYELAQKYYARYGHLKIPAKFKTENGYERSEGGKCLGTWICTQRKKYNKKELGPEYIEKLTQIGMVFEDTYEEEWERIYKLAKAYYEYYGHLRVNRSFKTNDGYTYHEDGYCLPNWLETQRMMYRKNKLSEERIKKLQLIGMLFVIKKNKDKNMDVCEQHGIDYKQNKTIIDNIAYRELISKINYLNSLGIPLTQDNQLHPIFTMGNINMQVRYGISLEVLITEYSRVNDKVKIIEGVL